VDIADLTPGQGRTGLVGTKQIAVFNDGGTLIVMENLCTHMGCQTEWNASAATWDCPCHGSRYHGDGSVMVGPALAPLRRLDFQIVDGRLQV
jgi:Rieske Fe-S protein